MKHLTKLERNLEYNYNTKINDCIEAIQELQYMLEKKDTSNLHNNHPEIHTEWCKLPKNHYGLCMDRLYGDPKKEKTYTIAQLREIEYPLSDNFDNPIVLTKDFLDWLESHEKEQGGK